MSGLTLGAMYAVSSISLSLLWGTLGVLNMAQGAFLVIGGYAAFTATTHVWAARAARHTVHHCWSAR